LRRWIEVVYDLGNGGSTMQITLRPELEEFVNEQVKTGQYTSPADVVEAALARLMVDLDDELDDETLAALDEADAQIDRGEGIPLDEAFERLRRKHLDK
jgi:antitoxin ParD1/3/4